MTRSRRAGHHRRTRPKQQRGPQTAGKTRHQAGRTARGRGYPQDGTTGGSGNEKGVEGGEAVEAAWRVVSIWNFRFCGMLKTPVLTNPEINSNTSIIL